MESKNKAEPALPNILLTGKQGQLGFELQRALAPVGLVHALDRAECDLADSAALRRILQQNKPDIIVNPAAYTAVDRAESETALAYAVNATALEVIGAEAAKTGALVLHFSTDYVFDGSKPSAYIETDAPNPQSVYGASKLAGEQALQNSGARHIILRTSWVFGAHGQNFAKTMLRLAAEREQLSIVADQHGAPTSAALLADLSAHILRQVESAATPNAEPTDTDPAHSPYGIFHASASGSTTWYDYARAVIAQAHQTAQAKGGPSPRCTLENLRPITSADYPTPAKRPANSRLDSTRLQQCYRLRLPPWQDGLAHVLQQIIPHH